MSVRGIKRVKPAVDAAYRFYLQLSSGGGNSDVPVDPIGAASSDWLRRAVAESLETRTLLAGVSGYVYHDIDFSGNRGNEPGIAGVTLTLLDNSGPMRTTVTAADGSYQFDDIEAGYTHYVEVDPPSPWNAVGDQTLEFYIVTDDDVNGLSFGLTGAASAAGVALFDQDGNGTFSAGDSSIGQVIVYADSNVNGTFDAGEPSTVSAADGSFLIGNILPTPEENGDSHQLRVVAPAGWTCSSGNPAALNPGDATTGLTFLFAPALLGSVSGTVQDVSEQNNQGGLAGLTVTLTAANGYTGTTTTDSSGDYVFAGLTPRYYTVSVTVPGNWLPGPNGSSTWGAVTSANPQHAGRNIGLVPVPVAPQGSIAGTIYDDRNADGVRQFDEPGLPDVAVWVQNLDPSNPPALYATTDSNGQYQFANLALGTSYQIAVSIPGRRASTGSGVSYVYNLSSGSPDVSGIDQGWTRGAIVASVRTDIAGSIGVPGATLQLSAQGQTVATATADSNGVATFADLDPYLSYQVTVTAATGYRWNGVPADVSLPTDTLTASAVLVAVPAPGVVSGTVFRDFDASDMMDPGEPGDDGWTIFADENGNGLFDALEPSADTASDGTYTLANLFVPETAASQTLMRVPRSGWYHAPVFAATVQLGGSTQTASGVNVAVYPYPVAAPSNATVALASSTEALLSWTASADDVDEYYIYASINGGAYELHDLTPATSTSYRFFSRVAVSVEFRVSAVNEDGESARLHAPAPGGIALNVAESDPITPTAISVGVAYTDSVPLSWQPVHGVMGYVVEWSNGDGEWFTIAETTQTTYNDEYPTLGDQQYRIRSYRRTIDREFSEPSEYEMVHPIAPPVAWYDDNSGPNDRETLSPYKTKHDTPLTFTVVPNDRDYDGSPITIPSDGFTQPEDGTVTLDAETSEFTFTPDEEFVGIATFKYWVTDGTILSKPATVSIDVINHKPVAYGGNYELDVTVPNTHEGIEYRGTAAGYVSASDLDSDSFTFTLIEQPQHGTLHLDSETGEFFYIARSSFGGSDRFIVTADDGIPSTIDPQPAAVTITSNHEVVRAGGVSRVRRDDQTIFGNSLDPDHTVLNTPPTHGGFPFGYESFVAETGYAGNDEFVYKVANIGALQARPATHLLLIDEGAADLWGPGINVFFNASNLEPSTFTSGHTHWANYYAPGVTLALAQSPQHGTLAFDHTDNRGGFTYTPTVAQNQEPYFGWDFFSFTVTAPWGATMTQWVQLNLGSFGQPLPILPPLPPILTAVSGQIGDDYASVYAAKEAAKQMLAGMLTMFDHLGRGAEKVRDANDLDIDTELGAATTVIDGLATQYDAYVTQIVKLNEAAGRFLAKQWYVSEDDANLMADVNRLPLTVGSLKASKVQMERLVDSLKSLGKGAGIAVDTATKVVTYAENTHAVLSTVEMAGGVTVLLKTGATLLVKEGIKACAKQAAKEVMQETASGVAANLANYAAEWLGLSQQTCQYIAIGVDAYQVFSFLKAAKAKFDPNGSCFVAGTNVITGANADGTYRTKPIEQIQVGDLVLSRDQRDPNDDLDLRPVTQVFSKTSDHIRTLTIQDADGSIEAIQTTDEHPFWVVGRGWTDADDITPGDRIADSDNRNDALVVAALREIRSEGVTVYNFEVKGDHTYFVADADMAATNPVWAHNLCVDGKFVARIKSRGIELPFGLPATNQTFRMRSQADTDSIQGASTTPKKNYAKSVASDPSIRETLLKNGVPADQIDDRLADMAATGTLPSGWQVHHVKPVKWGGDNSSDNFIIMKDRDWHRAITAEQNSLTAEKKNLGVKDGEEFTVDWVEFPSGAVIFAG